MVRLKKHITPARLRSTIPRGGAAAKAKEKEKNRVSLGYTLLGTMNKYPQESLCILYGYYLSQNY